MSLKRTWQAEFELLAILVAVDLRLPRLKGSSACLLHCIVTKLALLVEVAVYHKTSWT